MLIWKACFHALNIIIIGNFMFGARNDHHQNINVHSFPLSSGNM